MGTGIVTIGDGVLRRFCLEKIRETPSPNGLIPDPVPLVYFTRYTSAFVTPSANASAWLFT